MGAVVSYIICVRCIKIKIKRKLRLINTGKRAVFWFLQHQPQLATAKSKPRLSRNGRSQLGNLRRSLGLLLVFAHINSYWDNSVRVQQQSFSPFLKHIAAFRPFSSLAPEIATRVAKEFISRPSQPRFSCCCRCDRGPCFLCIQ